jgi:hypothetical protein
MLGDFHQTEWRCIGASLAAMHYFFNKTTSARLITFFPGLIGSGNIGTTIRRIKNVARFF